MKNQKRPLLIFMIILLFATTCFFMESPASAISSSQTTTYVIKKGDTLTKISKQYNTTVSNLKALNNLSSDTIYIGKTLIVPTTQTTTTTNQSTNNAAKTNTSSSKKVSKEVLGYTVKYSSSDKSSYNSMLNHKDALTSIATATYVVDGSGNLKGSAPSEQLDLAKSSNIKSTLMIGNEFNNTVATTLLSNATNRKNLITNTVNLLKKYRYTGVNVDIENISANQRDNYTALLKEMSAALKPSGYELSAAVSAKTTDNKKHTWNYAYDYQSLASYVDYLMIMTYDEHYKSGEAGAVASVGWVTNVLDYALTVVPKEKIVLGVAAYGYDWAKGTTTKSYGINGMLNLAKSNNASIQFDNVSKTPYFTYKDSKGIQHNVWYEDAKSLSYKLDLVNQKGIKGIGIWRLGLENDEFWNVIEEKL